MTFCFLKLEVIVNGTSTDIYIAPTLTIGAAISSTLIDTISEGYATGLPHLSSDTAPYSLEHTTHINWDAGSDLHSTEPLSETPNKCKLSRVIVSLSEWAGLINWMGGEDYERKDH